MRWLLQLINSIVLAFLGGRRLIRYSFVPPSDMGKKELELKLLKDYFARQPTIFQDYLLTTYEHARHLAGRLVRGVLMVVKGRR